MTLFTAFEENTKYEATAEKEFEKSITLLPDENIESIKKGTVFTGKLIGHRRGLIFLTNRRIIFVIHPFYGPDTLLYIPLNAISGMNFKTLGFLFRGAQRAIGLEYNNKSILFAITFVQRPWTGLSDPTKTIEFFEILKKKLSNCSIDETEISTKTWDYNLSLKGISIGFLIGIFSAMIGGALFFLLFSSLGYVSGFLIGKIINKLTK